MTTSTNNFDQLHEEFNTKTDDHAARQAEFLKLKTFGRIKKAPGVTQKKWAILDKKNVLSHSKAKELGIKCQTRKGMALFPATIATINDDIKDNGWDYYTYQPAVSEITEEFCKENNVPFPLIVDGEEKTHIVRDGNNRFETDWDFFPCAIIEGDEYDLKRFGTIANVPDNKTKKNDCSDEDVISIIQEGFELKRIEKTEQGVWDELVANYKEVRKKDRKIFVAEILEKSGQKVNVEPFDIPKAEAHVKKYFKIDMGPDGEVTRECVGFGRTADESRTLIRVINNAWKFPKVLQYLYSYQQHGQGVTPQPDENNISSKRRRVNTIVDDFFHEFILPAADAYRNGKLGAIIFKHLPQLNYKEKDNEFQ
tara:strand:- start:139 stop:1239 length:1101 start_codon:yes stop_codon:yes gene_type:complete